MVGAGRPLHHLAPSLLLPVVLFPRLKSTLWTFQWETIVIKKSSIGLDRGNCEVRYVFFRLSSQRCTSTLSPPKSQAVFIKVALLLPSFVQLPQQLRNYSVDGHDYVCVCAIEKDTEERKAKSEVMPPGGVGKRECDCGLVHASVGAVVVTTAQGSTQGQNGAVATP